MKAEILKIQKENAKDGGSFWYLFMKEVGGQNRSFRACVYEKFRNYKKWKHIIDSNKIGITLSNLDVLRDNIIDADSDYKIDIAGDNNGDVATSTPRRDPAPDAILSPFLCDFCGLKMDNQIIQEIAVSVGGRIVRLKAHSICVAEIFEALRSGREWDVKEMNEKLLKKAKSKAGL